MDIPGSFEGLCEILEDWSPGAVNIFQIFLEAGKYKYGMGIRKLVYRPGLSISEILNIDVISSSFRLNLFGSLSSYVRKNFKSPRLIQLLEFPVLFLGTRAEETPALYSLMNYADMALGTWYPNGGMYKVIEALISLATSLGVEFEYDSPVQKLEVNSKRLTGLYCKG